VKKIKRKVIIISVSILFVLSGSMVLLGTHFALKPKKFKAFLEYVLHEYMDEPVSIGDARLRFKNGLLVTIKDLSMGSPEVMQIDVKKLKAEFSLLKILTGELHALDLQFEKPEIAVYIEPFMKEESIDFTLLSSAGIENGSIKAFCQEKTFLLSQINGHISTSSINLESYILDGRASIVARNIDGKWKSRAEFLNLNLEKLECNINGTADIKADFEKQDNGLNLSLLISADNIDLPGNGKTIQQAVLTIDSSGTDDFIKFREINLKTNGFNLFGIGNLNLSREDTIVDTIGDALLNIKLGSDKFDFKTMTEYLPPDLFPEWLNLLLLEQIRNGNIELASLEYNGRLGGLKNAGSFHKNLYIKGILDGMSYGAGHSPDRITDLAGTVFYEKGNLSFKNISGIAGDSSIKSVDLIFPDIAADGLRLIINTDLEAKAKDFAQMWRAAMEPRDAFDLLAPLSNIKKGWIKAKVSYKEGFSGTLPQVMGTIHLNDCSFSWSDFILEDISGSASAGEFGLPFAINLSGKFNSFPINNLVIDLSDPLRQQTYDFTLTTDGPQNLNGFRLDNGSSIIMKGKGKGPDFYGDINVLAKGFELGGKNYIPFGDRIDGSGKLKGMLWPEPMLSMTDIKLPMGSARLNLQLNLKKIGGSMKVKGTINAYQADRSADATSEKPLMGGIDMILAWGEGLPTSGSVKLFNMSIFYNDSIMVLNGPITISRSMLSTKNFNIIHDIDTKIKLSGRLKLGNQNHFIGNLAVDNFEINPKESSNIQLPESLTGKADISMSNLNLLGFAFEKANMKAEIEKGVLLLNDINCGGEYGSLKGQAEFAQDKEGRFDVNIDLRNKGLENFFSAIYSNKFLIDGYLRLKGHIHGTTSNINGNLTFSARGGHILKSSLITRLFGALNFYKIIKSRDLDFAEKRFSYNKIFSSFDIENNLMTFDDFHLDSNSLQFSAVGNYNIESKIINSTIGVQPLETLDRAVSAIPVIGWVLTGEGKKLIVISFSAIGDINEPKIDLAPSDTLSQPVSETLIRILDLPERLIDKSEKMIPRLKK